MGISPDDLLSLLPTCWSAATSRQWRADNPARGQCNVTALLVQELCGGEILKTDTPGGWHYYNRIDGERLDLTASQFDAPIRHDDLPADRAEALAGTTAEQYEGLRRAVSARLAQASTTT